MAQQTFSGVPGDFTAGQVLTAAEMDKLREFLLYLIKDGDEGDTGEVSPLILDLGDDLVRVNDRPTPGVYYDVAHVSTDITANDTGVFELDSNLRTTVTAIEGDVIQITQNSYVSLGGPICHFVPYTLISASATNPLVPLGTSFNPWFVEVANLGVQNFTATYKCVAGDISSSTVTVGIFVNVSNSSRQVAHQSTGGMIITLTNLGPDI